MNQMTSQGQRVWGWIDFISAMSCEKPSTVPSSFLSRNNILAIAALLWMGLEWIEEKTWRLKSGDSAKDWIWARVHCLSLNRSLDHVPCDLDIGRFFFRHVAGTIILERAYNGVSCFTCTIWHAMSATICVPCRVISTISRHPWIPCWSRDSS